MIATQLLPHHRTGQGKTWEVAKFQVCVYNSLWRTGCQIQNLSLIAPFYCILFAEIVTALQHLIIYVHKDISCSYLIYWVFWLLSVLAVIRRSFCVIDEATLPLLFRTMVRPHLEYANTVWGPFNRENQKRVERVQRRATKLIASIQDRPYEERLQILDLPSMYHRRRRGDMITVYQILQQKVDMNASKFFTLAKNDNTRGHQWKLQKPQAVSRVRRNAFSVRIINEWNALPSSVVTAPSLNAFKARLDRHWAHLKFSTHIHDWRRVSH